MTQSHQATSSVREGGAIAFFYRGACFLSRLGAWASALLIIYIILHTGLEVVLRFFLSSSTYVLDEFVGYAMAGIVFLSLGHALESGAMVRTRMFTERMGPGLRRGIEALSAATTLVVTAGAACFFWFSIARNWERSATSETVAAVPLWLPESVALIGLAILSIQLLAYLLRVLAGGQIVEGEDGKSE